MRRAALVLFVLTVLWAPAAVAGLESMWTHDLRHHHVPWRVWAVGEWMAGRVPAWSADVAAGYPLMADGQTGAFYLPTMALFALFSPGYALNLAILLHHWWAGLGAFAWLRSERCSSPAAMLGAVAFAFSGLMATHSLYLGMQNAIAWLPWMLWGIRGGHPALTGLAAAMMLVAGHPQAAAFGLLLGGVVAIAQAVVERRERGNGPALGVLARQGAAVFLAVVAASPQLWATLELVQVTARDGGLPAALAHVGALPIQELMNGVFPYFFGFDRPGEVAETYFHRGGGYWGAGVNHWEMAFYLGLPVVLLAMIGTRRALFWAGMAVVSAILMLGGPTWDLVRLLPGFDGFRFPVRFAIWLTPAVAVLAATGLDRLRRAPPRVQVRLGWTGVGLCIAWVVGIAMLGVAVDFGEKPLRDALHATFQGQVDVSPPPLELSPMHEAAMPPPPLEDPSEIPAKVDRIVASMQHHTDLLAGPVLVPLSLFGGMATLLFLGPRVRRRWALPLALSGMVYADLWSFGADYQVSVPMADVGAEPASLGTIATEPGRTTVVDRRQHPSLDRELLSASLGLLHGTADVILTSPLLVVRHEALLAKVGLDVGDKGPQKVERLGAFPELVDLLGVRWLLSVHDLSSAGMEPVAVPGLADSPVGLYRNPDPLPPAVLVGCAVESLDPFSALDDLDPRRRVLLEEPVELPCSEPTGLGSAAVTRLAPDELVVDLEAARPAFLLQTESWYPGWEAALDGEPVPLMRADLVFRGVVVAAGSSRLVLRYRPSWRVALVPAALSWGTLLVLLGVAVARGRRRSDESLVSLGPSQGASSTG